MANGGSAHIRNKWHLQTPDRHLLGATKVFLSERERSDNQDPSVTAGSWCLCLPHPGTWAPPASIWLIVLLPLSVMQVLSVVSSSCKNGKKPPGLPLAHCAHQVCPAQAFDLMGVEKVSGPKSVQKTERKKKAETGKRIPWFCCSWLLCLGCSLWEGNNDNSPNSQRTWQCLKCFTCFSWSQLL